MSATDLRDKILELDDIERSEVFVPQWGVNIEVRSPDGFARSRLIREFMGDSGDIDYERMYPALVIATAHDPETGERLFTPADADSLNKKNGAALEVIARQAMKVSGFDRDTQVELGKDSETTPSDATTSG